MDKKSDGASIIDAIAALRYAFLDHNIKAPTAILLEDSEEAVNMVSILRASPMDTLVITKDGGFGRPIMAGDNTYWMEVMVAGVSIRWPAQKLVLPGGRFLFV